MDKPAPLPQPVAAPARASPWADMRAPQTSRTLSLNALLFFEVAARHSSFNKAAEELGVTIHAVSRQVRALENHLGHPLFHRRWRFLTLTELGSGVLPLLHSGFENIFDAVSLLQAASRRRAASRGGGTGGVVHQ